MKHNFFFVTSKVGIILQRMSNDAFSFRFKLVPLMSRKISGFITFQLIIFPPDNQ